MSSILERNNCFMFKTSLLLLNLCLCVYQKYKVTSVIVSSSYRTYNMRQKLSKIDKVPRGIQGEMSSKDTESSEIWSQQLEHKQVPKCGTEPGVRKSKRSLLACNTRCKSSKETTRHSVKVKLDIKVMKLLESLIGWEVSDGLRSECYLTFVKRRLQIVE